MKKYLVFVSLTLIILFTTTTQAQLIRIGLGGGYSSITSSTSIFDNGFHYGGKAVVGIPVLPINISANIYNNSLSKEVAGISHESSFLSVGLGGEFTLLPGPIKPYAAAELLYTSVGETKIADISYGGSESKFGLGLGAGAYFTLLPVIDLDLSAHYNMNTLLSSGDGLNSVHVRLNVLFSIF
ncbi:MAG: outer membrane beta-barrel protein [Bacteroidota bacterium]